VVYVNVCKVTTNLGNYIPEKYLKELIVFINSKKFGTFSFIIQNGEIVGCDILEKKR